ncbi:hypothetical protein CJJ07_002485 [Candidozyma auris]|nr:hypothetical protein CJJ07_002485 [[Candida] auris]QEL62888.1 hypothetical protein CJJ09_005069 [[Candida] auris]
MLWLIPFLLALASATSYKEELTFRPLPRNTLLADFHFNSVSPPFPLEYTNLSAPQSSHKPRHYGFFPRMLAPIVQATNTRELHLRFTQGWWDADLWGSLPHNGTVIGGTGVEVWAAIEAPSIEEAKRSWYKLTESLSGVFCASLNFVNDAITTVPKHKTASQGAGFVTSPGNKLFLLRAALPDEPICTENLTPFLKMLPTRGKAGIASLLDGHKLYDSLWHSMSVDLITHCEDGQCHLESDQHIHHVADITRSIRRRNEGGIPKPVPGDKLRCDQSKYHDAWHCFPAPEFPAIEWDIEGLYGRAIQGPGFENQRGVTTVNFLVDKESWRVAMTEEGKNDVPVENIFEIVEAKPHNFRISTADFNKVLPKQDSPLLVSRSLTGYSQDSGGMRVTIRNPQDKDLSLVYFESLPWFMRIYLHTLQVSGNGTVENQFFKPAIDRERPTHLELALSIPAGGSITLTYQFDKSLLLFSEYPPDANHGFAIEPAVVKIIDKETGNTSYQLRTPSLLLTLPTPDFSMPYNVTILTCTVMSLAFGCVFNLLVKKVVTEEEFEEISKQSPLGKLKAKIAMLKSKIKGVKA